MVSSIPKSPVPSPIDDLSSSSRLQSQLERLLAATRDVQVVVALVHRSGESVASHNWNATARAAEFAPGCLTKLLTAELLYVAAGASPSEIIDGLFADHPKSIPRALRDVTCRMLAEHTHGLDMADSIGELPRDWRGFVDLNQLSEMCLASPPIAEPGRFYNYSNIGSWLAAAIVERRLGMSFSSALKAQLGVEEIRENSQDLCPATGSRLRLSLESILAFLRRAMRGKTFAPMSISDDSITLLPGWHPSEVGIMHGWKAYGNNWFGHDSLDRDAPMLIRMSPRREAGILVCARGTSPAWVTQELFGKAVAGYAEFPTPAPEHVHQDPDFEESIGTYSSASSTVQVRATKRGLSMKLCLSAQSESPVDGSMELLCPERHIYLPSLELAQGFPVVQFIGTDSRRHDYLWNGANLWRRTPTSAHDAHEYF